MFKTLRTSKLSPSNYYLIQQYSRKCNIYTTTLEKKQEEEEE